MPFNREGQWITPTDAHISGFQEAVTNRTETIQPTVELVEALKSAATVEEPVTPAPNVDFFSTIGRLKGKVDVVIPVYGGLHVLAKCVDSVRSRTNWDYRIIFVNDASPDPEVGFVLREIMGKEDILITNKDNLGFAASVNKGIKAGTSPYVCVLNSDVIVTESWLTRMLVALESDPLNCIVNPVTNNTALINVDMYPGKSYLDMDLALGRQSRVNYPEIMPTGFCFAFRRELFNEIGPFDEAYGSYGEETDWWFRAIKRVTDEGHIKGYKAVLADNVYVFHERGTSFSQLGDDIHKALRQSGSARFHTSHPDYQEWIKSYDTDNAIGNLRSSIPKKAFTTTEPRKSFAWAVKSTAPCGGMYFISDIANELIEQGHNVKICLIPDEPYDEQGNPAPQAVLPGLRTKPIIFESKEEFVNKFSQSVFSEGTLLSAVTELSGACAEISKRNAKVKALNHVQSWDVSLARLSNREDLVESIEAAYCELPNITVSPWVSDKIQEIGGEVVGTVTPGVDTNLFHNRDRSKGDDRFTVGVLLFPDNPYKGYARGVELCKKLLGNADIRVLGIGVDHLPEVPGVICVGNLPQPKFADLLGQEIDVFVDPSIAHAYGLPVIEAVTSGCKAVLWTNDEHNGGYEAYYDGYLNHIMDFIDSVSMNEVVDSILTTDRTRFDTTELNEFECRSLNIHKFIDLMDVNTDEFELVEESKAPRIEVITPHMRKHGGPTTLATTANILQSLGNNVQLSMVYDDWNPEVVKSALVPVRAKGWENVPTDAKLVIINSDNPFAAQIMHNNPGPKYVMYKLSHNPRFQQIESESLNLPWDHIITSTEWLRNACVVPLDGWEHKTWDPANVTCVGWYHYGHQQFEASPDRTYGNSNIGYRVATLVHGHPLKGTEKAFHVIDALRRKYHEKVKVYAVGEQKARLPEHITYFPNYNRSQLANVFKQFDIWLSCSESEGLGRMYLEAMSAGVPVVAADTGAEFLKHEENCLLFEAGDLQTAAELCDGLMQDRDLFAKLIENGFQTAAKAADSEPFAKNLDKVVKEILDE